MRRTKMMAMATAAAMLLLGRPFTVEAAPQRVSYQGVLYSHGVPATSPVAVTVAVFDSESGGTQLWAETHPSVDVTDGVYSLVLGSQAPLPASVFGGDGRWLEVTVDGETLSPRQPFVSVPYSLNADTLDGADSASFATQASLDAHGADPSAHHAKTTSFTELSGQVADGQVPAAIARDSELTWGNLAGVPAGLADGMDDGSTQWTDGAGTVTTGAQVGIGTGAPGAKLDFGYNFDAQTLLLHNSSPGNARVGFGIAAYEMRQFFPSDAHLSIGTMSTADGSSFSEKLRVDGTGNVGIGTTSPGYDLQIGDVGATYSTNTLAAEGPIVSVGTGAANRKALVVQGFDGQKSKISAFDYQNNVGLPLSINPDNSNVYMVQNGGSVGIGTTSPNPVYKVHVNGLAKYDVGTGSIEITTPGGNPGLITYGPNGHRRDVTISSDALSLTAGDTSSPPPQANGIHIKESGNVGVGTTTPGQRLEVNGGIRLNTSATPPACDESTRGTLWFTPSGLQQPGGGSDSLAACGCWLPDGPGGLFGCLYGWKYIAFQ